MSTDSASERYRRRNRWPALAIVGVLAIVTLVTWIVVLKPAAKVSSACNQPGPAATTIARTGATAGDTSGATTGDTAVATTGDTADTAASDTSGASDASGASTAGAPAVSTSLGVVTDMNTLRDTRPANPATIALQVYNASTTAGMAGTVTDTLRSAGFESIKDAQDDVLYPASDLHCYGEIRYGAAGSQAARTVLIVAPCATLVLDNRFDDSVDFAVGALYTPAALSDDVLAQLAEIKQAATPPAVLEGQTQAAQPDPTIPPLPSTANCPA